MRASRIFDNGRGDKYEVVCDYYDSTGCSRWTVFVNKRPKGKRKFVQLVDTYSRDYLGISYDKKEEYRYREYLKEIPWSWVEMVMDDVCAEIRKLGSGLYPKY